MPDFSPSEARDENVRSLRSIAMCQQIQTVILLRQHTEMNLDFVEDDELEEILKGFAVGVLD